MIEIVAGTDRPGSNTLKVAKFVQSLYQAQNIPAQVLDLMEIKPADADGGNYFQGARGSLKVMVDRITAADGVVMLVPEYNGSYPGILKLFIDYWKYPETFEYRPFAFIGLGGRFGALRPVEHLQGVLGYRNGFLFPNRVFISNIKEALKDGVIVDSLLLELLNVQARDFGKYVTALKGQKLDANSRQKL